MLVVAGLVFGVLKAPSTTASSDVKAKEKEGKAQ
jgi:hypothetical protein